MDDTNAPRLDAGTLATIDRWLEYRTWHSQVPGAQVAIGVAGEVVFSGEYGYADLEQRIPMRADHLFRIASHSKTFTATLVLQLVDEGKVSLEDPIGRHVPELAEDPLGQVRVRELLEHTSGVLRDGRDAGHWQFERPFPDREQLLALVREGGPKRDPGELFAYSNLGYSLLGLLIESVTGQSYVEAADTRIVKPLGLANTSGDYLPERSGDYAVGYSGLLTTTAHGRLEHIPTAAMAAATGFTSTATDLVGYFTAHRIGDERLLSDRTKRLQQRPANASDPKDSDASHYGWGMGIEKIDDQEFVGHGGGYPGHITNTLLDPKTGLVVSVMTNSVDGPASSLAQGIVKLIAKATKNAAAAGTEPSTADGFAWTGRYASLWGVTDIAQLGGRLMTLDPTGGAPLEGADELEDAGDGRLRIAAGNGYGSVGEYVTFTVVDGAVESVLYGGMRMRPFPKLPERVDGRP